MFKSPQTSKTRSQKLMFRDIIRNNPRESMIKAPELRILQSDNHLITSFKTSTKYGTQLSRNSLLCTPNIKMHTSKFNDVSLS